MIMENEEIEGGFRRGLAKRKSDGKPFQPLPGGVAWALRN
jgi:hypothetical protein